MKHLVPALLGLVLCLAAAGPAQGACRDFDSCWLNLIDRVAVPGQASGVAVARGHAFVAIGGAGLAVVDLTRAPLYRLVGTVPLGGTALDVAVRGDFAYVAGSTGIYVVDVAQPDAATWVGTVATGTSVEHITVSGPRAFATMSQGGLAIYDLAAPRQPALESLVGRTASAVAVAGDLAYATLGYWFTVLDVRDPRAPATLARHYLGSEPTGVALALGRAYVSTLSAGVKVFDLEDPGAPLPAGSLTVNGSAQAIAASDSLVFVAKPNGVAVIELAGPGAPYVCLDQGAGGIGAVSGLFVAGDCVYLADIGSGLFGLQLRRLREQPAACLPIAALGITAVAAAGDGNLACVLDAGFGLHMVDVADPGHPAIVGAVRLPGSPQALALTAEVACVAAYDEGLQIVDLRDPLQPTVIGAVDTPGLAWGVAVRGSYAYVADGGAGLQVVDIADRAHPRIVGTVDTWGYALDVAALDQRVLVADYGSGICEISITTPTAPERLRTLETPGEAWAISIVGNTAYVADGSRGLHVVEVTGSSLVMRATIAVPGFARDLTAFGADLYIATHGGGVQVVRTSSLPSTTLARFQYTANLIDTPGNVVGTAVTNGALCVADQGNGLTLYARACESVAAVDTQPPPPGSPKMAIHPNPTSGRTQARLAPGLAGEVQADIYDLAGRRVRRLARVEAEAGGTEVAWDGCDHLGRPVPAGVYLMRVRTSAGEASGRVLILR